MKKKLILSSIAAILIIDNTYAQDLGTVTITTATKSEKSIDGIAASVIVITSEDIKKTGASTIKGVLEKIPSINAQFDRFPHPSAKSKAAISLRGVGANGTLILIDGKRLSAETENPYEMNRIPASMIERIEIVKGSMSTLYGSDAIGGVINIITKKVTTNVTHIDVKYGSNLHGNAKDKNLSLSTMGIVNDFKYKVYGSFNKTTPFTKKKTYSQVAINPATGAVNTGHAQHGVSGTSDVTYRDESSVKSIGTRIEKDLNEDIILGFDINYFKENREGIYIGSAKTTGGLIKNTPVNSKDVNRRIDVSTDIDYSVNEDLSLDFKYYRSYYKKRNETDPINFVGPTNTKFSANVTIDTFESNAIYSLNDTNLIVSGFEYRKEKRESSAINPDASSSEFITKIVKYKSLFIQDEIELADTLHATVGIRYDNISNADNKATLQAGIIKNINNDTNIRFNYSQGYRAPDIAELYVMAPFYKDAKRFGSEVINTVKTTAYDLKPEESQSFEVSISNKMNSLSSELTLFTTSIKDKIELVSYNDLLSTKYYTSENIKKVNIKGAELSLDYIVNDDFDLGFNLTYLDTKNEELNKELMQTPDISASLNATYKVTSDIDTSLMIRYIGEQYEDSSNTSKTEDYSLVDISASYKLNKTIELYAGIDNIFDKEVDEILGTNIGTFVYTGLRVKF